MTEVRGSATIQRDVCQYAPGKYSFRVFAIGNLNSPISPSCEKPRYTGEADLVQMRVDSHTDTN